VLKNNFVGLLHSADVTNNFHEVLTKITVIFTQL